MKMRTSLVPATLLLAGCAAPAVPPTPASTPPTYTTTPAAGPLVPLVTPTVPVGPVAPTAPKDSLAAHPRTLSLFVDGEANGFARPTRLVPGPDGALYLVCGYDDVVRRIGPDGAVGTVLGVNGKPYAFAGLAGVACDPAGNLYALEERKHVVSKMAPNGVVVPLAGDGRSGFKDGRGTEARFGTFAGIAVSAGGTVAVSEQISGRIRLVQPDGDTTTYVDGDIWSLHLEGDDERPLARAGVIGAPSLLFAPSGRLYYVDTYGDDIHYVDPGATVARRLTGRITGFMDGRPEDARFNHPTQIALAGDGTLYVADTRNHAIRRVSPQGNVETLAGDGFDGQLLGATDRARMNGPEGVALSADGKTLYIADTGNDRILALPL